MRCCSAVSNIVFYCTAVYRESIVYHIYLYLYLCMCIHIMSKLRSVMTRWFCVISMYMCNDVHSYVNKLIDPKKFHFVVFLHKIPWRQLTIMLRELATVRIVADNPVVTCWFPTQRANNVGFWCWTSCWFPVIYVQRGICHCPYTLI